MGLGHSPSIVVDGLVFIIDPNNPNCYPGFGNTLYNIVNTSIGGTFVAFTSNPIDNTETRSLYFDGSSNFIQTNYIPYFTSDFTMEVFAKFTRYNDYQCILSSMNNGNANSGFWFEFGSGRGFTIYTTGSQLVLEDNVVSLTNLELNKWHHIIATRSGTGTSNVKLYVNNILCGQNTSNATIGHTSFAMMVGKYDYVGNYSYFKGNVGSVKIYNRGLSATEILQNYNATKKKYMPEENIVTNGLVLNIDTANPNSYSGTGNTVYDLSGFGNTGTLTNGPTYSSLNSGSIVFDGTNDFINLPNTNLLTFGTNPFTIDFWMYSTYIFPGSGYAYKTILSNYIDYNDDFGSYFYLALFNLQNSTLQNKVGVLDHTGNFLDFSFSVPIVPNQWTHIALTRNGSTFTWYKNGTLQVSSSVASNNFSGVRTSKMGGGVSSIGTFEGRLPSMRIYNKTLTAQEILQNYNATKKRFVNPLPPVRNGLVLELDAGQRASYPGTGNTWYDLSGNSLNGALTNGPTFSGIGVTSSIVFDGSNDYIDCGYNSIINSSTQFTIECWYKSSNISVEGMLFSTFINSPSNLGYHLEIFQSKLSFQVYPSGQLTQSTTTLSNNTWYQLITVYNSGAVQYFVNGQSAGTASYTFNPSSTNLLIGKWPTNQYYLNGQMAITKFYNRVLSAYEVKQNFDFYRTRYNI